MSNNYTNSDNVRRRIIRDLAVSSAILLNPNLLINTLVNEVKSREVLRELMTLSSNNQQSVSGNNARLGNDRVREILDRIRREHLGGGDG